MYRLQKDHWLCWLNVNLCYLCTAIVFAGIYIREFAIYNHEVSRNTSEKWLAKTPPFEENNPLAEPHPCSVWNISLAMTPPFLNMSPWPFFGIPKASTGGEGSGTPRPLDGQWSNFILPLHQLFLSQVLKGRVFFVKSMPWCWNLCGSKNLRSLIWFLDYSPGLRPNIVKHRISSGDTDRFDKLWSRWTSNSIKLRLPNPWLKSPEKIGAFCSILKHQRMPGTP